MNFTFRRKRISGILTVVPANERSFVQEMKEFNFPAARSLKLKEVMGYDKRRLVEPNVCISDLAVFGLRHLFERGCLNPDEIDALLLVTQSPDHFIPPTSNIIQGRLGLKRDMLCMDINQACAGYVLGLIQAFLLLEQESIRKVVHLPADGGCRLLHRGGARRGGLRHPREPQNGRNPTRGAHHSSGRISPAFFAGNRSVRGCRGQ